MNTENPENALKNTITTYGSVEKPNSTVKNKGGRPPVNIDPLLLLELRAQGWSWELIARSLGCHRSTAQRKAFEYLGRTTPRAFPDTQLRSNVKLSMLEDLKGGFRPSHKQLTCYNIYLEEKKKPRKLYVPYQEYFKVET